MADADGIDKLSMRNLARSLGFEVMSLYNHVANKDDLLEGMTDQIAAEIELPPADTPWADAMRSFSRSTKAMFERHQWAVMLWVTTMPGRTRFDLMEWQLDALAKAELDEQTVHNAFHAIDNHVIGYMLQSTLLDFDPEGDWRSRIESILSPEGHQHVRHHIEQHLNGEHGPSFDYVLDLIIDGIAGTATTEPPT
jgi:AcrR family transcriptional regulator